MFILMMALEFASLEVNRWIVLVWINVFLLVPGCFLPPVAVILMRRRLLLPCAACPRPPQVGFDTTCPIQYRS
jgi:TRAP-type C4-dicarboxylate transport system permease large subunit